MRVTATATRASNTARRASAASRATLSRQDERARRAGLPCHGKTSERGEQGYLVTARRASAASRATDLTEHARSASGPPPLLLSMREAHPARLPLPRSRERE